MVGLRLNNLQLRIITIYCDGEYAEKIMLKSHILIFKS